MNRKSHTVIPGYFGSTLLGLLMGALVVGALIHFTHTAALSAQSRDECHKCCESQGYDEYYLDQCKLQCFRNPEHCTGGKSGAGTKTQAAPAAKPPAPAQIAPQESPPPPRQPAPAIPQQPREQPPAVQPTYREQPPAAQRPPAHRQSARAPFQWPNPLTLVPGRESDAAAQIIVLNGIPPQHPNFQAAVGAVTAVLIDFARNNPGGGALPTTQLEQIIKQFR